ncbi:hypothetical protein GCM10011376_24760 [Nocardioides flavus (ex Wang et al. 2016)]|uniref:TPM domain-containing protein n=1 Tax=Nocardioides flavus (ex Wang et al. 2016) TaxID=2058780 RepID=A0ABQ3HMB7_9ACTN|nr:hypothetical protein [Nocardioides flavus (ex Wang et al. 2016)]GHE17866.1 hypothetical protein GCM10011376_24760 [Nocardioides flavus (ex Wang et al. 2016)]
MSTDEITDETIAEIEQELDDDGVWIDPAFARSQGISADDEARIEEAVAQTEQADLNVVLVEVSTDDERFQGSFGSLSAWIHDGRGGDATYVGWEAYGAPEVQVDAYGDQPDTTYVDNVAAHQAPDDLADQVVRIAEIIDDGNADRLWDEVPDDEKYYWTADEGVQASEVLGGLGVVAVLAALVAGVVVARRRRRARPTGFTLPTTVLHTIRSAEDRRLRQQADAKVLALGEAIGRGEPGGTASSLDAWQQALDHYAAARSILQQAAAPADVVGALVLARRGDDARATAERKEPAAWTPQPSCWFNPLHDGPTSEVVWRDDERQVDVPACTACAADVREGREPRDVLDFIEGDRTVHYYRLDLGAWTRTGYGALERDLLGALRSGAGRLRR